MRIGLFHGLTRQQSDSPSLSLDLRGSSLDARVTFSRASAATDVIAGTLQTYSTDQPRLSTNGLLIEEPRTNSLRNGQASGSAGSLPTYWGITNAAGLTATYSTVVQNGFTCLRVALSGTPTASAWGLRFESPTQIAAVQNQVWTGSFYHRLAAGSLSNISSLELRVAGVASSGTAFTPSSTLARASHTRTLSDAGTANVYSLLQLNLTIGQPIDLTLDIAAVQLELGAFASSYIPTTTAAATRAADLASMAVNQFGFVQPEGTLWVEAQAGGLDPAASSSPRLVRLDSGGSLDVHEIRRVASDSTLRGGTTTGNSSQSNLILGTVATGQIFRAAYAFKNNDMTLAYAGTTSADNASPNGMPTNLTTLRLGAVGTTSGFANSLLRGVKYWPRRLSSDQLKALTS